MKVIGYLISIIIYANNFVGSISKKNTKLLLFVTFILMWIIFGWNYQNPDYDNYLTMYRNIQHSGRILLQDKDLGFKMLMNISSFFGLSYQMFVIAISLLGLSLITSTVIKYSPNKLYVFFLYFIYPYFLDIVQIRNFLMMSLIIFSVRYLVEESNNSKLKYLIMNLIAISIHSTATLYLPFVLIKFKNKNVIKVVVFFFLSFSAVVFLNNNEIPFVEQIVRIFTDNRYILRWFTMRTNFGFLLSWFLHSITYLLMLYSKKIITNYQDNLKIQEIRFFNVIYWINVIGFCYFIFYMVNTEFTRLMRNISILNYISFSIVNKCIPGKKFRLKYEYNILVIIHTFIMFTIQLLLPHLITVIKPVLENNLLW